MISEKLRKAREYELAHEKDILPEERPVFHLKPESNLIRVDRTQSGLPCDIVNVRDFPVFSRNGELKLRLIMDRYSLEVFVNDGEQAASFVIYTPLEAKSIQFASDGLVVMDVEKYDLEMTENE